jgi:hypothetical protein
MNKGVFDANKLHYEFGSATKLSNKHVDTSKATVVAEVLNPKT